MQEFGKEKTKKNAEELKKRDSRCDLKAAIQSQQAKDKFGNMEQNNL